MKVWLLKDGRRAEWEVGNRAFPTIKRVADTWQLRHDANLLVASDFSPPQPVRVLVEVYQRSLEGDWFGDGVPVYEYVRTELL